MRAWFGLWLGVVALAGCGEALVVPAPVEDHVKVAVDAAPVLKDRGGVPLEVGTDFDPLRSSFLPGQEVWLTIDSRLQRELEKILQLEGEFDRARKKVAQIERRVASNRVNLISFLDQVSRSTGVSISQMDPAPEATSRRGSRVKEETVRVNIAKVKVGPLARFMDRIENSGRLVKIRRLIVKPTFANRTVLEVSLHVSTYRLKKK